MFLIDTNVLSETTKPQPDAVVQRWMASVPVSETYLSVVTIAEIRQGITLMPTGRRPEALTAWLEQLAAGLFFHRIVPVDEAVALRWGELTGGARREGQNPDAMDAVIAATAAVHGYTIATRNIKDFAFYRLPLLNPWTGESF